MRRRFERLRKSIEREGLQECVLFSYRHSWITAALKAGVDIGAVAELAGTSVEMIGRHYLHLAGVQRSPPEGGAKAAGAMVPGAAT